ncbi:beta-lactamase family protein [Microbacterium sp. Se63.02b]|nr:beta-lactamase family protein [Microbacterium sp. Se63.02b]
MVTTAGRDLAAGGFADLAGTPMTTATAFDIASVSKVAATTTVILRLVSRGDLDFDDPVERFLPGTPCAAGTTVRHLLQHRAGLWEWQPLYLDREHLDPADAIDAVPLRYGLDEGRHYSDLGFMLLGRIIAVVTGTPLDAAVRELVTAPSGSPAPGTVRSPGLWRPPASVTRPNVGWSRRASRTRSSRPTATSPGVRARSPEA